MATVLLGDVTSRNSRKTHKSVLHGYFFCLADYAVENRLYMWISTKAAKVTVNREVDDFSPVSLRKILQLASKLKSSRRR